MKPKQIPCFFVFRTCNASSLVLLQTITVLLDGGCIEVNSKQ